MITTKKAENVIGWLLTFGTLFSALIMIIGGISFLWQNGHLPIQMELNNTAIHFTTLSSIVHAAIHLSPRGIIELGAMFLVATQLLRVGLLVGFYIIIRDYPFIWISLFILIVLLYTFFYAH